MKQLVAIQSLSFVQMLKRMSYFAESLCGRGPGNVHVLEKFWRIRSQAKPLLMESQCGQFLLFCFFFGALCLSAGHYLRLTHGRESHHHRQSVSDTRVPRHQLSHEDTWSISLILQPKTRLRKNIVQTCNFRKF